jgi:hypothetical protein
MVTVLVVLGIFFGAINGVALLMGALLGFEEEVDCYLSPLVEWPTTRLSLIYPAVWVGNKIGRFLGKPAFPQEQG